MRIETANNSAEINQTNKTLNAFLYLYVEEIYNMVSQNNFSCCFSAVVVLFFPFSFSFFENYGRASSLVLTCDMHVKLVRILKSHMGMSYTCYKHQANIVV